MPRKKPQPKPAGAAVAPLSQAEWRAKANALLDGPCRRERLWTRLYIEGMTPEEAAAVANTYVYHNRLPRDRKR
jgi:hypothetical protein